VKWVRSNGWRKVGAWTVGLLGAGIAAGAAFIYSGVYNISATEQHIGPVYWLIEATMRRAVHVRASSTPVPDLSSATMVRRGLHLYHVHCERCHGGPGVAPESFALGLTPAPANLTDTARRWDAADIYWVIKYGIKMTAMPAWQYRLQEQEIWDIVAFVHRELRQLSPGDYRTEVREVDKTVPASPVSTQRAAVSAEEGKRAMQQYACATCHYIPGITGATKPVGPTLRGIGGRSFIGGVLSNTSENMVAWLMSPQRIDPLSAMPDLGVTEHDARNIAAYLETLLD
jgi:mono/diheme cytochrome c family protein